MVGFEEQLRADVVAISKSENAPWVFAFEVKVPSEKWELKNWLKALRQAGDYPNCNVVDVPVLSRFCFWPPKCFLNSCGMVTFTYHFLLIITKLEGGYSVIRMFQYMFLSMS